MDIEMLVRSGAVTWDAVEATWREIRGSPRGWLRYAPDTIERRLDVLRTRLGRATERRDGS